jgi:hypothetical protein
MVINPLFQAVSVAEILSGRPTNGPAPFSAVAADTYEALLRTTRCEFSPWYRALQPE